MVYELAAYALAGSIGTAVYFLVAFGLGRWANVFWAIFWAFWVSLPVSYLALRWIVFGVGRSDWDAAPRFFVVQLLILLLNLAIAHMLSKIIRHQGAQTQRLIIAAAYILSGAAAFIVPKFWVF